MGAGQAVPGLRDHCSPRHTETRRLALGEPSLGEAAARRRRSSNTAVLLDWSSRLVQLRRPDPSVNFRAPPRLMSIGMTRVFDEDLGAGFGTRAIHAGQRPEPLAGAIMTPVYLTSTYVQEGLGQNKGYEYARGKNPTREAFERNVAALENGKHGFAFSSGMGCIDSIMKLFRSGDHIVCAENVYGGTFRLFDKLLQNYGLTFSYVDTRDTQQVADAMTPATRAILLETPSNPLMRLTD